MYCYARLQMHRVHFHCVLENRKAHLKYEWYEIDHTALSEAYAHKIDDQHPI